MYDNSIQKRLGSTCNWILDKPEFRRWVSPTFPAGFRLLWINGPAAFGKTILCARIVEHLLSVSEAPVAHFFFSSEFESRGDPYVAIKSWLVQILYHPKAFEIVRERWEAQDGQMATRAHIVEMFRDIVHTIPECQFVMDGLDECTWMGDNLKVDASDSIAGFLETIRQAVIDTDTRILVVSRGEPEIRQGFLSYAGENFLEYKISPEDVRADTESYARSIVNRKLPKKTEIVKDDLSQRMAERCHGQFLWLKMQEGSLRSWQNTKQLKDAIDASPTWLEHIYERNKLQISRLPERKRSRALSLLRWAAFALRPLTVCEITEALLIDEDRNDLLIDEMPDFIDEDYVDSEIVSVCGSLIDIRDISAESQAGIKTVHLAHFSVRQYLVSNMLVPGGQILDNERLRASNELIQSNILGRLCLRYINFRTVWEGPIQGEVSQVQRSFRDYAASSWYQHATMNEPRDIDLIRLINTFFDASNENWNSWRMWFDQNESKWDTVERQNDGIAAGPLYYASRLGMVDTIKHLLQECKDDLNGKDSLGRTALGAACEFSKLDIVQLLLEAGANTASTDIMGRTPLHIALTRKQSQVVKLLLGKGADINVTDNNGWAPLNIASWIGNVEVVKLLLEKGADITVTVNNGWDPLYIASWNGNVEVVKLLLENGARFTPTNGYTPLYSASANGNVEVVKLLLEKGADFTLTDSKGYTPLFAASTNGHVEIVKLLLEKGADVTGSTLPGYTPLYSASVNGHVEVVKLLLEKGANVTISTDRGSNPLHTALAKGNIEIAKLLLEKVTDINVANNSGWTFLNTASFHGNIKAINLLLEKGADITIATNRGSTPLHTALTTGHDNVVKLLLEQGTEVNTKDKDGLTPLYLALEHRDIEIVKLLLQKGADINAITDDGWSPLHLALEHKDIEVVKLLLKEGADITTITDDGWSPLHLALRHRDTEVVKMLVKEGADMTAILDGWSSLHIASIAGRVETVQLLLEDSRVDATAKDENGRTALFHSARCGHYEVVQVLLAKYPLELNSKDKYDTTPLVTAVINGHVEVAELLFAADDNCGNSMDCFGRTLTWWARRSGDARLIELVQRYTNNSGLKIDQNSTSMESGLVKFNPKLAWCDICTSCIPDGSDFYMCSLCDSGRFASCLECFDIGAHCLNASHKWDFQISESL
jgi:ankyrin repeat protein